MNDLPSVVSYSKTFIFADDMKCLKSIMLDSDHKLLQEDLNSLSQWSREWKLLFNESKFRLLQFRSSAVRSVHTYNICGQNIKPSTCHKDHGNLLTDLLTWEEHYNYISSRTYKQLGLLKRTYPNSSRFSQEKPVPFTGQSRLISLICFLLCIGLNWLTSCYWSLY